MSDEWKLQHHVRCECARCIDHPSQARPGIHVFPDRLYVVTMLENPLRWRSRYWNYWMFERECKAAGAILYTAEVAFGERHFEVTQADNPRHLQLRTASEIWHKENALNLVMQRLPAEAKYVAWIDADVKFNRPDWAQETMQLLPALMSLECVIRYYTLGTVQSMVDRGRVLGQLDSELLGICQPTNTEKCDYTQSPSVDLGTSVFWNQPVFQEATTSGVEDNTLAYQGRSVRRAMYVQAHQDGRVERQAGLTVFFFSEVTLL